jgi:hypothetical protein
MIRMNERMRHRLPAVPLQEAKCDDVPESLRRLVQQGWTADDSGAYLLQALLRGYSGSRSVFTDLTGLESSVNGLAIPDWDIPASGDANDQLLRRAVSYACLALYAARDTEGASALNAIVSVSESLMDNGKLTARVTFVLDREDEPPLIDDVECRQNEDLLVFSLDDITL